MHRSGSTVASPISSGCHGKISKYKKLQPPCSDLMSLHKHQLKSRSSDLYLGAGGDFSGLTQTMPVTKSTINCRIRLHFTEPMIDFPFYFVILEYVFVCIRQGTDGDRATQRAASIVTMQSAFLTDPGVNKYY
jgi:hypothetical protein